MLAPNHCYAPIFNAMNTCKTCIHWKVEDTNGCTPHEGIVTPTDPDTYEPMKMPFEVRHCMNPALLFCERPVQPDGFCVADGSTYMAHLMTSENFGCVLHNALLSL